MSIMFFYLFWLIFETFLFTPSNMKEEAYLKQGYDSEFNPFMKKMFSKLPGEAKINQEIKGADAGYRPYWYAYNFALEGLEKQTERNADSSHEDWDAGLGGGSGKGLWGGGNLSLMAAASDDIVGAAALLNKDLEPPAPKCYPNMGKNCVLGPPPVHYSWATLEYLWQKTIDCDQCSEKYKYVGVQCTTDASGTTIDMDRCVMEKMNCLGGMAYINTINGDYYTKFSKYPFAMKPQWARLSIRGAKDADIKLFNTVPYRIASYWLVIFGWPYSGPKSAIYPDTALPYWYTKYVYFRYDWHWGWAINPNTFTEYSIVWNPRSGWFLMSQPRAKNWLTEFYMEYTDPYPRDFKYIDVASGWSAKQLEFILHDLPTDLMVLYDGPCKHKEPGLEDQFPSDTEEVSKETIRQENAYLLRRKELQKQGYNVLKWSKEQGSYVEY